MRLRDLVRIRVPRKLEGLLVLGLEYGKRSVSARASEEGLVVPMACLNRVWCCGFYVSEGQKNRVSLSASEENRGLAGRFRTQKGRVSASEEKVLGRRFWAPGIGAMCRVHNDEPVRAVGSVRVSVRVSEEIPLDLGP